MGRRLTVYLKDKQCALCKHWLGDPELTRVGSNPNINTDTRGDCTVMRIPRPATATCKDFSISPRADAFSR